MICQTLRVSDILAELQCVMSKPRPSETAVAKDALIGYAKWMKSAKGYEPSPESISALFSYMKGYGLFLMGGVGTGKTFFFRSLRERVEVFSMLRNMAKPLDDISREVEAMRGDEILLDDIGAEPVYNNYGSRLDLLPWLIEMRLESPMRTHFTSNLKAEALMKRYGARVMDRVKQMAKCCIFTGESRRKLTAMAPEARSIAQNGV